MDEIIQPRPDTVPPGALQAYGEGMKKLPYVINSLGFQALRPGQDKAVMSVMMGRDSVVILPTGMGKCFAAGTPILMYDGSVKPVECVEVGDAVMGENSRPRVVSNLVRGRDAMFEIKPTRSTQGSHVVNGEHTLSLVITPGGPPGSKKDLIKVNGKYFSGGQVIDITVREYLAQNKTFKHRAKLWKVGVEFEAIQSVTPNLPPYILGVWLGDGSVGLPNITNPDEEVIRDLRDYAGAIGAQFLTSFKDGAESNQQHSITFPCDRSGRRGGSNVMKNALRAAGVLDNKHIPRNYLLASRSDRLELLAGIVDTDGDLTAEGAYTVTFKQRQMSEELVFLVRSLGLRAMMSERSVRMRGWTEPRIYYRVYISGNVEVIPCRIDRKKAQPAISSVDKMRSGFSVRPLGEGDYYGFSIAGPDKRFLLGDFTVTHNSFCFVVPTLCMGWKTIVIYPLIALMRDQAMGMQKKGLAAACISSNETDAHNASVIRDWSTGNLQFMLVSPERFANANWAEVVTQFPPDFVCLDECFVGDVEILTVGGFVRFDELKDGTRCAQVDPDNREISYVTPSKFIRRDYAGEIVRMHSTSGVDLEMTPNHDILRYRRDGSFNKVHAHKAKFSYHWRLLGAPTKKDGRDELTPDERLQVAYQADGNRHSKTFAAFSFSKERKIARFLQLMKDGDYKWSESNDSDPMGRRRFLVRHTAHLSKIMRGTIDLSGLSTRGCRALVEEAITWDGSDISDTLGYFSCTMEENTDFFQEACVLAGMRSRKTKQVDDRKESYKDVHRLFIRRGEPWIETQNITSETRQFEGEVFCVEVPTGCIVVRRHGKPVVIGNCHTFGDWADTFRPGYKFAGEFIRRTRPKVVAAYSATLSEDCEAEVREGLGIAGAKLVYHYPRRANLHLKTMYVDSIRDAFPWVTQECEGPTIIYASTRARVEGYADSLARFTKRPVYYYHGGMKPADKKFQQDKFMADSNAIIVATNAFGMGIDKALPLDANILTPKGWVKNSDVKLGDVVTGADGLPTGVVATHECGEVRSFRVSFDDGNSVVCAGDHLWAVRTPKEKCRNKGFTSRTTLELAERIKDTAGNHLWFIPLVKPVEFSCGRDLPMAPYLLGALLGDGGLSAGNCVKFHKDDQFILDKIRDLLPPSMRVVRYDSCQYGLVSGKGKPNPLLEILRVLGLAGCNAYSKFVPELYLTASAADRLLLLQGLMDTDGGPGGGGGVGAIFCTASTNLRDSVVTLSRSLGGTPTIRQLGNGHWQVYLMLPNGVPPFLLPRKQALVKNRTKYAPSRCVVSITEEQSQVMRCITVAAPDGLFVTDNFVVTHNCDIRNVVHFDIPGTLVAYSQECGRGGRDGKDSYCTIIPTPEGVRTRRHFIRCGNPTEQDIRDFVKAASGMRSGRDGVINAKRDDIARKAGLDVMTIGSIMAFCLGEGIFVHDNDAAKKMRIKFMPDVPSFTKVEAEMRDAIQDLGVELDKDGWLHLDIRALSEQVNREPATVMSRLRTMNESGKIEWVRSTSTKPLRLGIDIDAVDPESFARLNAKSASANACLKQVLDYCDVADDEKHAFLESHLNR